MGEGDSQKVTRVSIQDAMRMYGLTARAIRFYGQRGLVEAARDRQNTRLFDGVALRRLGWIARLRRAHLPLIDIAAVLEADAKEPSRTPDCATEHLEQHRRRILEQLARVESALADLSGTNSAVGRRGGPEPANLLRSGAFREVPNR